MAYWLWCNNSESRILSFLERWHISIRSSLASWCQLDYQVVRIDSVPFPLEKSLVVDMRLILYKSRSWKVVTVCNHWRCSQVKGFLRWHFCRAPHAKLIWIWQIHTLGGGGWGVPCVCDTCVWGLSVWTVRGSPHSAHLWGFSNSNREEDVPNYDALCLWGLRLRETFIFY